MIECDVASDAAVRAAVDDLAERMPVLHGIVHSIAWAPAEDLQGSFVETSRDGFAAANDISSYSLIAVAREARRLMTQGGAIVTMTYAGSWRVIPNYNVMGPAKASLESSVRYLAADLGPAGVRVNAVSAGPIAHRRRAHDQGLQRHARPAARATRRCGVTSPPVRSPTRPSSCSATCRARSPARSCTSTPARTR